VYIQRHIYKQNCDWQIVAQSYMMLNKYPEMKGMPVKKHVKGFL